MDIEQRKITKIHDFRMDFDIMASRLDSLSKKYPSGLIIPVKGRELRNTGLDVTTLYGKGKDVWIAVGIASLELYAFALHDSDVLSYSKMIPTKLLYPVIEPKLDFFFAKGYYARVNMESKKMYGRLYRLFITPLLEALQEKLLWRSEF